MGGGNAQKSATARARNEAKKAKAGKGSQLAVNKAAQSIICQVCTAVLYLYGIISYDISHVCLLAMK